MTKIHTILEVKGMTCGHCAGTVIKALKGLKGVHKTNVNLKKGLVKVIYDSDKVSVDALEKAVITVGYEASVA